MNTMTVDDVIVAKLDADYSGFDEEHLARTQETLLEQIDSTEFPRVVLDLSDTKFFGSMFLEALFRVWHRVNRRNGRFALAAVQPYCQEVIETARLHTLWSLYPTVDAAVQGLKGRT